MSVTPWLFDLKMLCVGVQIEERSHCPSTFGPNCIFLLKKEMHEILNLTQPSLLSAWKWQGMISGTFASTTLICWMTHSGLVVNTRESSSFPPTWWENTNLIHHNRNSSSNCCLVASWEQKGMVVFIRSFICFEMFCWNVLKYLTGIFLFNFFLSCWASVLSFPTTTENNKTRNICLRVPSPKIKNPQFYLLI